MNFIKLVTLVAFIPINKYNSKLKKNVHQGKILLIKSVSKCQNHAECVVLEINSKIQMS